MAPELIRLSWMLWLLVVVSLILAIVLLYFTDGAQKVPSGARVAAGAFGFLTLIQAFDGPDR